MAQSSKTDLINSYFEANTNEDIEKLMSVCSDDISAVYPSKLHPITGKPLYRQHIEKSFKGASKVMRFHRVTPTLICVDGQNAIARWKFEYQLVCCCCTCTDEGFNSYTFDETGSQPLIKSVKTESIAPSFVHKWGQRLQVLKQTLCCCC